MRCPAATANPAARHCPAARRCDRNTLPGRDRLRDRDRLRQPFGTIIRRGSRGAVPAAADLRISVSVCGVRNLSDKNATGVGLARLNALPHADAVATLLGCCFFFRAEDGIRDATVTGVQTCALPI